MLLPRWTAACRARPGHALEVKRARYHAWQACQILRKLTHEKRTIGHEEGGPS